MWGARGLRLADVSGNGHLDLVFSLDDAEDAIIVNRGDGTFEDVRVSGEAAPGETPKRRVRPVADYNGDGRVEIPGGSPNRDEASVGFLVDPLGERRLYPPNPTNAFGPSAKADVNGDGITDLYRV